MAFDNTGFLQIPVNILTPGTYAEFDASRAVNGLPTPVNRTLIIGQRLAVGTVAAETLKKVRTPGEAKAYFGRGSMLAAMIGVYMGSDPDAEVWAIAVDDDADATAATRTITVAGTSTAAGTIPLQVTGKAVNVTIASGVAAAAVATAIAAAINAKPDLPVTAAAALGVVTLTARNKGLTSGGIDTRDCYNEGETLPAGITLAHAAGVAGAGNPDLTDALAAIGDQPFLYWVNPYADAANLALIEAALATRADALHMSDGVNLFPLTGSLATIETAGLARNSPFSCAVGVTGLLDPAWEFIAALSGQVSASANIDPAVPFTDLVVPGIKAMAPADEFIRQERQYLLEDGVSTVRLSGGNVVIDRLVTTYKTDTSGEADTAWQDLNTLLLMYYLRWSLRNRIATKFPRYKLGSDGGTYAPTSRVVTPSGIRAEVLALFLEWETAGLVENFDQFKADVVVERDDADPNRVNILLPPDLINQYLITAVKMQFRR
jgi:phage tail sheath gpL-like